MLAPLAAAAVFILGDGYEPAIEVAWLCPTPEAAAEIGVKVDKAASPGLISALAVARKCVSWERGTLNILEATHLGTQELGLIRVSYGGDPTISYWVARNTVRWSRPGGKARVKP